MTLVDTALLFLLAAIWGASFLFMRVLAPLLGPVLTADLRTLIAGLVLVVVFALMRTRLDWRKNFRHYLVVGVFNSALPFFLFTWAALHVSASIESIVNALTPLWGAVFGALILREALTVRKLAGIALGIAGVAVIALLGTGATSAELGAELLPVLACLLATICYGFSGAYIKRWAKGISSRAMTASSLLLAVLVLLPPAALVAPPLATIAASTWALAALFAILCSAIAYLIYFRLMASAGLTAALSVTLLIPVFAFLWSWLLLGETLRPIAFLGAALILGGTALITTGKPQKQSRA
ncbi:MAG: DMT family transporter [Spirochaetota bacterium]